METLKRLWVRVILASAIGGGIAAALPAGNAEARGDCSFAIYGIGGCACASGGWTRCVRYGGQCINVQSCDAVVRPPL